MVNTTEEWIKVLNNTHGTNVKYVDIKDWDMKLAFLTTEDEIFKPLMSNFSLDKGIKP